MTKSPMIQTLREKRDRTVEMLGNERHSHVFHEVADELLRLFEEDVRAALASEGQSGEAIGPRPVKMSCKGCPAHIVNRWSEPSGDGETFDSGTEARCAAADNREISTYCGAEPSVPDWCPAYFGPC